MNNRIANIKIPKEKFPLTPGQFMNILNLLPLDCKISTMYDYTSYFQLRIESSQFHEVLDYNNIPEIIVHWDKNGEVDSLEMPHKRVTITQKVDQLFPTKGIKEQYLDKAGLWHLDKDLNTMVFEPNTYVYYFYHGNDFMIINKPGTLMWSGHSLEKAIFTEFYDVKEGMPIFIQEKYIVPNCNHSYKTYTGLIETFEYCEKCNEKK